MKLASKKYKLTDMGNAERFGEHHADDLRYVAGVGWLSWDEKRWGSASKGEHIESGKKTVRAMYAEAAKCEEEGYRAALADWAASCESEKKLMAMLRLAQSDPQLAVVADELDANDYHLNCNNGIIDLRTLKLLPHDPKLLCTKLAPVTYDIRAECPTFLRFIDRIFASDQNLIAYVQRLFGNAITGDSSAQHLPILWGEGANGKSTLVGVIAHLLGDYAGIAPESLLTVGRNEHPTEMADLHGRRFMVASETDQNAKLHINRVKQLTGEVRIKARKMRQDFFEFRRTHKLFMQTNNKPRVSEDTEATWRRLKLIPFSVIIPEPERDPHLIDKLIAESSGILNWLLIGCKEWQTQGFGTAEAVADATRHYREESDPIGGFIDDCCTLGPDVQTATGQLRSAYETYCKSQGTHPINGKVFAARLDKLGCTAGRSFSGRFWNGIGLLHPAYMGEAEHVA